MSPLKEKSLSIPRSELQAAVLGAGIKLNIIVQVDFQIDNITLYSDLKVTLNCISNSSRKFLPFVMNRLNEFRANKEINQMKYIPGDINSADMCVCVFVIIRFNIEILIQYGLEALIFPTEMKRKMLLNM